MLERIRLAHSIYLTDRSLAMLSGFPSAFVFNEGWVHALAVRFMQCCLEQQHMPFGGNNGSYCLSPESTTATTSATAVEQGEDGVPIGEEVS